MKTLLHVGCSGHPLPGMFTGYDETRLDIDPNCSPDILASMTDMGEIGTFDMIYCSHALEHLYPHDVPKALGEFLRVLNDGGHAIVLVPDLQGIEANDTPLYETAEGPVTGLDLIYGVRWTITQSIHWAHHTGFIDRTLEAAMKNAGFRTVIVKRMEAGLYNLMAIGVK